ncbi:sialate O-acetylesterase [Povalibacter sp.]|uniref:sialate O-acetylesterase n=1 Tax=Povalibacter sp. TaxID=1962978 RepID=UPI002F3EA3AB
MSALVCGVLSLNSALAASLLSPLFTDHAVLQRDQPIAVWGHAKAGERVVVSIAGSRAESAADREGRWSVSLPAMSAGGPYTLNATADSGDTRRINDVLIGDVWLCSGQSNMALPVNRALDARSEIANAKNGSIRLLSVPLASSARPQTEFASPVGWQPVTSSTIPEFSAACWYFARELQKTVDVPMGLIAAAWGGSKIEPWISTASLRAHGGYDEVLDILAASVNDPWRASARWGSVWENWWRKQSRTASEPWSARAGGDWRKAPAELGPWEEWGDERLASYNGMVWYRTTVSLTPAQAAQSSVLSLGQVDEVDQTWVNERPIGAKASPTLSREKRAVPMIGTQSDRTYRLPPGTLVPGENLIVVNVLDTYATGGLRGPASSRWLKLADGTTIPLDRDWLYQVPPAIDGAPPRAPWENVAGLSVIFNGMIAPLTQFSIRGVAWYQGEANTEAAAAYGPLLERFMADWRTQFRAPLPFLIVQLANYGAPPTQPTQSGWADLREQQRRVVARDTNAGLVIAVDIGERTDIHPANKQEVGRRLARAARHVAFGESVPPSGPRVLDARRQGGRIVVSFADVTGKLVAYSALRPVGFELCGTEKASCRFVDAVLAGERVALDSSTVPDATRVRYCWADSPVCTLFDEAPLPAGPFEIEVQP